MNIAREVGDRATEGKAYFNLGKVYKTYGFFPNAIEYYKHSLNNAREAGDRTAEGDAYLNLGGAYGSYTDFPKAIDCYTNEVGNRSTEEKAHFNLGNAYKTHGDFPNAILCSQNSLHMSREEGDRFVERRAICYLTICYFLLREYSKACQYLEEHFKIVNGVGGNTEEAAEGRTYNIHGNFYRPF